MSGNFRRIYRTRIISKKTRYIQSVRRKNDHVAGI